MLFSPGVNRAQVIRASKPKPRLAAVAAALQDIERIFPFSDKTVDTAVFGGNFYVEMSSAWWTIFGGCPFDMLKVHGVFNTGGQGVSGSMKLVVKELKGRDVYFNQTADDFEEFHTKIMLEADEKPIDFFISMHFSGAHLKDNRFINYYDLSPWSFPVKFSKTWLLNRPVFTYKAQELPTYNYYKQFKEYRDNESIQKT